MSARRVRRPFRSCSANARSLASQVERLESRELLSDLPVAQPPFTITPFAGSGPPSGSFTPAQIQEAYQFNQVSFNGSNETIAIVDAYNDPDIQSNLNTFDTEFNLPSTTVSVVNETGGSSLPSADPTGGWEVEESLDVEWAHAMAPGASIMLVEASSADLSDLLTAVSYASKHANVVSMSWGSSEFSGETADDSDFDAPGVAFVVASGDSGAPAEFPATSPNVLGVGGTTLTVNSSGDWESETGWGDSSGSSTGGPSAYEPQPSYQTGVVTQTSTARATPDVAYDAGEAGSYCVYDSYPDEGETLDWVAVWGTSAGAPQWSAILAIADEGRAANGLSALNTSSDQQAMDILYQNPGDFHDITTGTSTGKPEYSAGPGYDYVTGLGTPMVNLVVGSLDGTTSTTPPDTMVVSAPSSATAGNSFTYTVTAENPTTGSVDTSFAGTIRFTSTDSKIQGLPSTFTFTTANDGVASFTVTLETAGSQTITETSASGSVIRTVVVSPATASKFVISGLSNAVVGVPEGFTVTAEDAYGNVATGYTGTVEFTSSDTAATLPGNTPFTSANAGTQTFSVTFGTVGTQSLTVSDINTGLTGTQSGISVSATAPPTAESIWGTSYTPSVNSDYDGETGQTFELGVQFESNVAGLVTGVLFYKQAGTSGTNVAHLWSSTGTLLASATFTSETSSGWQEVSFSSPVAILANTVYTVSYDTGSPLFYYDSEYFASGGVTNGNLTAPQSTTINGKVLDNGVYNYGGEFPSVSEYYANFWVDVAFSPSTSTSPPAAPTDLAATAVSSSQINLTWDASAGATGYEIERSQSATSGFAEVGTATTTSYSDTGLTAGTTYYYQVIATGGGNSSAASNTASATTTATAPPTTESIWGTSYTPSVNSDYDGSKGQTFELGVQFESNVAGELSGVLFYKQRGTSGTNVAHLWSSTGTLLASATFTSETSSGWQKVSFSSPVAILANTIYTVSYDTGSPLFYYDSEYFAKGGVTNGNLTAPADTDINNKILDNGVYNYGGEFPSVSEYYANFWVDVAFSPSSGSGAGGKRAALAAPTSGPAAVAIGQSGYTVTSAGSPTPAGPMGTARGSQGTSSSTARRPSVSFPVVSYRVVVRQARVLVPTGQKAASLLS